MIELVDQTHREQRAAIYRSRRVCIHPARFIHLLRQLAACRHVGEYHMPCS